MIDGVEKEWNKMIEDIRYLIIFAKVAEMGSISKGAKALGLSNATVSLHLARLEKNLECALFYRNTRQITLTNDGKILLETAKSILELYENGLVEFKQRAITTKSKLNISIPAIFIKGPFLKYIYSFCEDYPDLTLNIICDDQRNDIVAENIDVAFRIGELPDSSLKAKYLFQLPRSIVATPQFLKQYKEVRNPQDLEVMKWIGLSMRPNVRILINTSTKEEVEINYSPNISVNNVEASYQLMKLDAGLAAPPDYLTCEEIKMHKVIRVLPQWKLSPLNVYAIWPANVPVNSIAYKLIHQIYEKLNG